MKLQKELVSIILPVSNASTHLRACLDSLIKQSYPHLEIIVIDDDSKDDSYKIASIYKKLDSRIKVFKNKKKYGAAISFNRGIKRAKGQFVSFMNPHGVSAAHKIKKQVDLLLSNPKMVAVGTQCKTASDNVRAVEKSDYPLEHESIYQTLLHGLSMRFETTLINRQRLPMDLLKFTTNAYPFIYVTVFLKLLQYGRITNLKDHLHTQLDKQTTYSKQKKTAKLLSYTKLLVQSVTEHDYRPSVKEFLKPLLPSSRTALR